jgi:dTDP-L-rhamnose 4-epimerase
VVEQIQKTSGQNICIVTGGAGFIGCAASVDLVKSFDRVIAFDNLHPQIHQNKERPVLLDSGVELYVGDVTEASAWDALLANVKPTVIIHLAAETGTGQSLSESHRHGLVNVCGTTAMLDGLSRAGVLPERFVLMSSRAVYGEGNWSNEAGETVYPSTRTRDMLLRGEWDFPGLTYKPSSAQRTPSQPCSVYGATKFAQEMILNAWCVAHGVELSILRAQNVYGPGQSLTNSYTGIVALFCRLARQGKAIPLYEDGAMLRDFVLIDDVAAALLAAVRGPVLAQPVDVGTGVALSVEAIAGIVAQHYGAPEPVVTGQYRFGDVRHAACDVEPTKQALPGWAPRFSFAEGLTALTRWIDRQYEDASQ